MCNNPLHCSSIYLRSCSSLGDVAGVSRQTARVRLQPSRKLALRPSINGRGNLDADIIRRRHRGGVLGGGLDAKTPLSYRFVNTKVSGFFCVNILRTSLPGLFSESGARHDGCPDGCPDDTETDDNIEDVTVIRKVVRSWHTLETFLLYVLKQ